jgi:hypothetical protein
MPNIFGSNKAVDVNIKVTHDFNTGIEYYENTFYKNCSIHTLGSIIPLDAIVSNVDSTSDVKSIVLRNPKQFFRLDSDYYDSGQVTFLFLIHHSFFLGSLIIVLFLKRVERGIVCNVFVSNRTDYRLPGQDDLNPTYWVFEVFFRSVSLFNFSKIKINFN